jgi:hypothetical protein
MRCGTILLVMRGVGAGGHSLCLCSKQSHVPVAVIGRRACVYALPQLSNPKIAALASMRDTSRVHDKHPVAFHRGYADDERQAILHVAVEDLRNANGMDRPRVFYPDMVSCLEPRPLSWKRTRRRTVSLLLREVPKPQLYDTTEVSSCQYMVSYTAWKRNEQKPYVWMSKTGKRSTA